jgi:predicted HAD superfamily phosphohydrolase YqeG
MTRLPAAHILAGFTLGCRHRRELVRILRETPVDRTILDLDPAGLKSDGIRVLALDFDGVLSPHGDAVPLPAAQEWLGRCAAVFGEANIFILSNRPTEERRLWFGRHFPAMRFISGVRKKPFPDGLERVAETAGVPPSAILMVDDRLLTGCLGALVAGARPAYIRAPYVSLSQRPLAELLFMFLRTSERLLVRLGPYHGWSVSPHRN